MAMVSPHIKIQPCRSDLTIQEEDDIQNVEESIFTPTSQAPEVIQLHVPPPPLTPSSTGGPDDGERPPSSMARVVRSLQLMKKWVAQRERGSTDRDIFMERFKSAAPNVHHVYKTKTKKEEQTKRWLIWGKKYFPLSPTQFILYWWLALVTCCVLYNCFLIIARETFHQLNEGVLPLWFTLDYISDVIYILDIGVQFITSHLNQGLLETDIRKLAMRYIKSRYFWLDMVSLIPLDLLYLISQVGTNTVVLRLNRLLRIHRMIQFFHYTESRTNYPNFVRVWILMVYISLIIHWNACIYFLISERIGFGSDTWVYPAMVDSDGNLTEFASLSRQYLLSFYWSTLTLTTIGELPGPRTDPEFAFVILDFLVGVLIFATIVGMVGGIIANMNIRRMAFQRRLDNIKHYMTYRSVGKLLQGRVIKWFDYLWSNKHFLDEQEILSSLPDKLKAEIAIHVHFETLRRVKIFEECEAGLLEELVLKLKPQVYSPGDYVCRKGDVGKEMYIIKTGRLEVVGDNEDMILATLTEGGYFGEISILNLSGFGNRRTASVRSVGFSELFALSKSDLLDVLTEYPEAKASLVDRGRITLQNDDTLNRGARMSLSGGAIGPLRVGGQQQWGWGNKGTGTPPDNEAMAALTQRVEQLEQSMEECQSRFARLMGEYNATQLKLQKKIHRLEGKLKHS